MSVYFIKTREIRIWNVWFICQHLVHCLAYKRCSILVQELTTKPPVVRGAVAAAASIFPTTGNLFF